MLLAEAQWVGRSLGQIEAQSLSPLLNVGSATAEFREKVQPWIDGEIFAPLRQRSVVVDHLDIQKGDGVDLQGDLQDESFTAGLAGRGYRAVMCCNLLEHVPVREDICATLEAVVPPGGYLVVTVPNRFPYHPDPIDTMFRPDVHELVQLFPRYQVVAGEVIDCGTGWDYVGRNPATLVSKAKRRLSGRKEHGGMSGTTSFLPWLFRTFRQCCVLLRKEI